jgi:uncharacterized membrane protein
MNRQLLDDFAAAHQLSAEAARETLVLTAARPDGAAWRQFLSRLARGAGLASLIAGVIFFVAANWQGLGVTGRFVLLQAAFAISVGLAVWRAPPQVVGQAGLLVAMMLVGALFALFGQTYQTGADVYELFFAWAALALPFAIAAQSGVHWAVWWCILNVALALFTGFLGAQHFMWGVFDRWGFDRAALLMAVCAINLIGAVAFARLAASSFAKHAPEWLTRLLLTFGILYGTLASIMTIGEHRGAAHVGSQDALVLLGFAAISVGLVAITWRAKRDVFPLALIAAAWIAISTAFLGEHFLSGGSGGFFMIAIWIVLTSTAASLLLMKWIREWRDLGISSGAAS